jgi:prepilin-type N-terminal cleavage/methylation domain-containing protein/prepilin-type processing-associated H-X9-DG protein
MTHRFKRAGFTLVELLVVIAIIGVLVALLLPAVQAARESARRMQCANNLKQMGLGFMNYHDSNKWFPQGAVWRSSTAGERDNRGSFFVRMLPYVEQQALYNLFDMSRNTDDQRMTSAATSERLVGQVITTFICPSDTVRRRGTAPNFIMPASYHTNMGPNFQITNNGNCSCPLFQTFRTFSRPNTGDTNPPGPFTRRGWQYQSKMSDCLDGLSNTIFVGEARAECSGHINGGWSASNRWGAFTQVPINFDSCRTMAEAQSEGKDFCYANCNWNTEVGFKSLHPGGCQFVFGDGSVHFLQQNIDMKLYNLLGDKSDRKAASIP